MGFNIPSEQELASRGNGGNYSLLPEDEYLVEVKQIEVEKQPDTFNGGALRDVAKVRLGIVSFADGSPAVDVDGKEANDRLFFDFIDINKVGMKPRPSKARKFFAACLNQPVGDALTLSSFDELLGKRIVVATIHRTSQAGVTRNTITEYRAQRARTRPTPAAGTTPAVSAPAEQPVDLASKAKEIFGSEEVPF
jgi:hypothetical protein